MEACSLPIGSMQSHPLAVSTLLIVGAACHRSAPPPESVYAPPDSCNGCHAEIAQRYEHVAMARSLYRPTAANIIEDYEGVRRNVAVEDSADIAV